MTDLLDRLSDPNAPMNRLLRRRAEIVAYWGDVRADAIWREAKRLEEGTSLTLLEAIEVAVDRERRK